MAATDGTVVVPPSKSDQSAIIQSALNKCASNGGGIVMLAPGKHRLNKPVVVPSGVTLSGVWAGPHHAQLDKGSVILAYAGKGKETDPPLIKLSPNSTVKGLTFYYPEQHLPDVIPYPWTIQGEGMHGNVLDITLVNAYNGIDFGTYSNELHHIRNVYGCILKTGVYIDKCTDIGRVENVHFNHHYWVRAVGVNVDKKYWDPLFSYSYLNTTAFKIGRADWEMFSNTFSITTKIGYHFINGTLGPCNGSFVGIGADYTQFPILVDGTLPPGLLISNGQFVAGDAVRTESIITTSSTFSGALQFSNCSFWGPSDKIADISGNGTVSMVGCNFSRWPQGKKNATAMVLRGGSLSVQGCTFSADWDRIIIEKAAKSAVFMGNTSAVALQIDKQGEADVQALGNVVRGTN
ncbi:MAG: hypothetical protein ABFD54_11090 [Armatimonadota bacterium]